MTLLIVSCHSRFRWSIMTTVCPALRSKASEVALCGPENRAKVAMAGLGYPAKLVIELRQSPSRLQSICAGERVRYIFPCTTGPCFIRGHTLPEASAAEFVPVWHAV